MPPKPALLLKVPRDIDSWPPEHRQIKLRSHNTRDSKCKFSGASTKTMQKTCCQTQPAIDCGPSASPRRASFMSLSRSWMCILAAVTLRAESAALTSITETYDSNARSPRR